MAALLAAERTTTLRQSDRRCRPPCCSQTSDKNTPCVRTNRGYAVAQLVEALRYKPECSWFDSR